MKSIHGVRLALALALLVLVAWPQAEAQPVAAAPDTAERHLVVNEIEWVRTPNSADAAAAYPPRTAAGGGGAMECRIAAQGRLEACRVLAEAPAKQGFGAGMLKLQKTFLAKIPPANGASPVGRWVLIPTSFRMPERMAPPSLFFLAGGDVSLLTTTKEGQPSTMFTCATPTDAMRQCYLHAVSWDTPPVMVATAPLVRKIGLTAGQTVLQCRADETGRVAGCQFPPDLTASQKVAFQKLLEPLVASKTSADGVNVSTGVLIINFDWETIVGALNASTLTRSR